MYVHEIHFMYRITGNLMKVNVHRNTCRLYEYNNKSYFLLAFTAVRNVSVRVTQCHTGQWRHHMFNKDSVAFKYR